MEEPDHMWTIEDAHDLLQRLLPVLAERWRAWRDRTFT